MGSGDACRRDTFEASSTFFSGVEAEVLGATAIDRDHPCFSARDVRKNQAATPVTKHSRAALRKPSPAASPDQRSSQGRGEDAGRGAMRSVSE